MLFLGKPSLVTSHIPIDATFVLKNSNSYIVRLKASLKRSHLIRISQLFQYHLRTFNHPIFVYDENYNYNKPLKRWDFSKMKFSGSLVFFIHLHGSFTSPPSSIVRNYSYSSSLEKNIQGSPTTMKPCHKNKITTLH